MLTCTTSYTGTALNDSVYLTLSLTYSDSVKVLLNKTVSRLISKRSYGSGSEGLSVAKDNLCIFVGLGLILSGEVKVNIRLLVTLKSKEGLERNIKAVLVHLGSTLRAHLIRHITARVSAVSLNLLRIKVRIFAVRTNIVRTQGVNLRDSRSKGHKGRTY